MCTIKMSVVKSFDKKKNQKKKKTIRYAGVLKRSRTFRNVKALIKLNKKFFSICKLESLTCISYATPYHVYILDAHAYFYNAPVGFQPF